MDQADASHGISPERPDALLLERLEFEIDANSRRNVELQSQLIEQQKRLITQKEFVHFQRTVATEEVEDLRKKLQISRSQLKTALKALEDAAKSQTDMFRPPLHMTSRQNENRLDTLQAVPASSTPLKDTPLASRPLVRRASFPASIEPTSAQKRKAPVADAESIKPKDPRLQTIIHVSTSESQSIQIQPRVAVTSIQQCTEYMGKVPLPLDQRVHFLACQTGLRPRKLACFGRGRGFWLHHTPTPGKPACKPKCWLGKPVCRLGTKGYRR
ncbi:hypothetical protein C8R47DRAFT_1199038 [Mycena vitilis]|nr:hypothetical protein C8R47DRAFT_1199038 [Mycena vitilis]